MVNATGESNVSAMLMARQHQIQSSMDADFTPHELLEGSLAACTILTLQLYARRKQWQLDKIAVQVRIDSEGPSTRLTREITVIGTFSHEERERLLFIANKCPIHKILSSHIEINSVLLEG